MKPSELNPAPDLSPRPIAVVCDQCRATGMAGDPTFAGVPDILDFEPVPRRPHANGWTPERQRAFVAALALTGSRQAAARAIGRHAFGAEQLRKARGGRAFAAACDAALDLCRERELARIHANLGELAAHSADGDSARFDDDDDADADAAARDYDDAMANVRRKLVACRRLYLAEISEDEARRAAWEVLCGSVDWDLADQAIAQPGESEVVNMRTPEMVLTVASGWAGAVFGTPEEKAAVNERMERLLAERGESTEAKTNDGEADAST
jgi:hypothetical protein